MKRVRQAFLLLIAFGILAATAAPPAGAFGYNPPVPRGIVGTARPTIGMRLLLKPEDKLLKVVMWLNAVPVPATFDPATGFISYTPEQPLAPGEQQVRLAIHLDHPDSDEDWIVALRFTFTVAKDALVALPEPGGDDMLALERVNAYRTRAGLTPMTYNLALGAAARGHANWMAKNNFYAHVQMPNTPLFFGMGPGDRSGYFGYLGGTSEVVHLVKDPEEAVDVWMDTLYHRLPLLTSVNTEMGFGNAGRYAVINTGPGRNAEGFVVWPPAGASRVEPSWNGVEEPNPLRIHPGVYGPVGTVITLTFGTRTRTLTLTQASLTGPSGEAVEILPFHPGNDNQLSGTVAMIPRRPLERGKTYRVRMAGTIDTGNGPTPYDHAWSFTTRGKDEPHMLPMGTRGLRDIGEHWARPFIVRLVDRQIIAGMGDGSFQPDSPLTRAAFVKMLVTARSLPLEQGAALPFSDTQAHWSATQGYLGAAVKTGILKPAEYSGARFEPDRAITRDEIAVMLIRAFGLEQEAQARKVTLQNGALQVGDRLFTDAAQWGNPAHVAMAVELGIISGYEDGPGKYRFLAANSATRAEAAAMLVRALDRVGR